ncbi:MAG: hypothetical protein ACFUZC_04585 [Chthoniobacteraceae bacterium]
MARKRIITKLPPLRQAFPSFVPFEAGQNQLQIITNLIRECATKQQRNEAQPFYTMREVAAFFSVSLRTIALSYETLDREGVLCRIRGSGTMLASRGAASRQLVNAVVGMPIWLRALIASPFECRLQMELEDKLRTRGFVADSIFFRTNEECEPDFTDRLARHNLDVVIWHSPHPLSSHVLMSLRDRGIRLILLQSAEWPLSVPARTHLLEWHDAYQTMAKHWFGAGIRRVVIPEPEHLLSRRALLQLKPILEEYGLGVVKVAATATALTQHLLETGNGAPSVLAFMDLETADSLCNGHPELIETISEQTRIAFCRGPVRVPRLMTKRICVDVVELNPETLAEGIVKDLCDVTQKQDGIRGAFRAEYHSQVIMGAMTDV